MEIFTSTETKGRMEQCRAGRVDSIVKMDGSQLE